MTHDQAESLADRKILARTGKLAQKGKKIYSVRPALNEDQYSYYYDRSNSISIFFWIWKQTTLLSCLKPDLS